mmetsp:Transcript_36753/g.80383  ORF Transcript_36753/g.80383 Transcript_36753/m.80383 type:complete len:241 (-) Transcript_36753:298-1020(-)
MQSISPSLMRRRVSAHLQFAVLAISLSRSFSSHVPARSNIHSVEYDAQSLISKVTMSSPVPSFFFSSSSSPSSFLVSCLLSSSFFALSSPVLLLLLLLLLLSFLSLSSLSSFFLSLSPFSSFSLSLSSLPPSLLFFSTDFLSSSSLLDFLSLSSLLDFLSSSFLLDFVSDLLSDEEDECEPLDPFEDLLDLPDLPLLFDLPDFPLLEDLLDLPPSARTRSAPLPSPVVSCWPRRRLVACC